MADVRSHYEYACLLDDGVSGGHGNVPVDDADGVGGESDCLAAFLPTSQLVVGEGFGGVEDQGYGFGVHA